jgi:hypothetical protein
VYDNLKAAVNKVLKGRDREEQVSFIAFRSHYLFESRFCNVAQAHEKGLVEGLVGYSRRNFLVPIPEQDTWDELNSYLWGKCKAEGSRRLRGMQTTIGQALDLERSKFLPLPSKPFPCCRLHPVRSHHHPGFRESSGVSLLQCGWSQTIGDGSKGIPGEGFTV